MRETEAIVGEARMPTEGGYRRVKFVSPGWRRTFAGLLGIGSIAVFWLPTRIAPAVSNSESYMFGFNNRVCEGLFVALLLGAAAFAKWGGLVLPRSDREPEAGANGLTVGLLLRFLALTALLCGLMYWLVRPVGGVGDGGYFLDRIHLIERGQTPFRDFEFVYGSASLYVSIFLARLFHIASDDGYYLLWTTETLAGVLLMWFALRWIDLPEGGKRTVFLLYGVLWLLLIQGGTLNYIGFRYSLPLFALAGFSRLDRQGSLWRRATVVGFGAAMTAALLLTSPEEGVAYALTLCLYLPVRRYVLGRPFLADLAGLAALLCGLGVMVARTGAFDTMKRFGAGAFNLPVYLGPLVLFAFTAMMSVACYVVAGSVKERVDSNVSLLLLYGLGMLPGAMGRCDGIHLAGYWMPIFMAALLIAWQWSRVWRLATIWFGVFFLVLPVLLSMWSQPPVLGKALLNHVYAAGGPHGAVSEAIDRWSTKLAVLSLGEARGRSKLAALRSSLANPVAPHQVFPGASRVVAAPFKYLPNKVSNYQAGDVDEGRFLGMLNILTPADVEEKIGELRAHPEEDLVVSAEGLGECEARGGDRAFMRQLLETPWIPAPRHEITLLVPYCRYLQAHYAFVYAPSARTFGYGLMRRRPD